MAESTSEKMDVLVRIGGFCCSRAAVAPYSITPSEICKVFRRNAEDTVYDLLAGREGYDSANEGAVILRESARPTKEGTGSENFSTRSTGLSPPSLIISSRRESTVCWICGRIASMCSRVKRGAIMLLQEKGENQVRFKPQKESTSWALTSAACVVVRPYRQKSACSLLPPFHPRLIQGIQGECAPAK